MAQLIVFIVVWKIARNVRGVRCDNKQATYKSRHGAVLSRYTFGNLNLNEDRRLDTPHTPHAHELRR